jgi:hypothetical protein
VGPGVSNKDEIRPTYRDIRLLSSGIVAMIPMIARVMSTVTISSGKMDTASFAATVEWISGTLWMN